MQSSCTAISRNANMNHMISSSTRKPLIAQYDALESVLRAAAAAAAAGVAATDMCPDGASILMLLCLQ
jgi:hypothetical protein